MRSSPWPLVLDPGCCFSIRSSVSECWWMFWKSIREQNIWRSVSKGKNDLIGWDSISVSFTANVPLRYCFVIELLGCRVESLRRPHIHPRLCPKAPGTPGLSPSSDKPWLFVTRCLRRVVLAGRGQLKSRWLVGEHGTWARVICLWSLCC